MAINRLNHAVLYVRDAERSATFFTEVLGFRRIDAYRMRGAVFLRAEGSTNDHDLGLFSIGDAAVDSPAGRGTVGLYHLGWEVDTLSDLARFAEQLTASNALVGSSDHGTTKALYARDPDGLEFELTWIVPADQLTADTGPGVRPLDLVADMDRYGPDTLGGVGVSRPAAVG
ncbi:MAG: VOC family protein [Acidimicrobiia bacterium]|nr:VOC family protein [Acidimicrobiia bacterium]